MNQFDYLITGWSKPWVWGNSARDLVFVSGRSVASSAQPTLQPAMWRPRTYAVFRSQSDPDLPRLEVAFLPLEYDPSIRFGTQLRIHMLLPSCGLIDDARQGDGAVDPALAEASRRWIREALNAEARRRRGIREALEALGAVAAESEEPEVPEETGGWEETQEREESEEPDESEDEIHSMRMASTTPPSSPRHRRHQSRTPDPADALWLGREPSFNVNGVMQDFDGRRGSSSRGSPRSVGADLGEGSSPRSILPDEFPWVHFPRVANTSVPETERAQGSLPIS